MGVCLCLEDWAGKGYRELSYQPRINDLINHILEGAPQGFLASRTTGPFWDHQCVCGHLG